MVKRNIWLECEGMHCVSVRQNKLLLLIISPQTVFLFVCFRLLDRKKTKKKQTMHLETLVLTFMFCFVFFWKHFDHSRDFFITGARIHNGGINKKTTASPPALTAGRNCSFYQRSAASQGRAFASAECPCHLDERDSRAPRDKSSLKCGQDDRGQRTAETNGIVSINPSPQETNEQNIKGIRQTREKQVCLCGGRWGFYIWHLLFFSNSPAVSRSL